jgi:hypothetical protein
MISSAQATQAYIDSALVPLVKLLRASRLPAAAAGNASSAGDASTSASYADALLAYEIFNEPEGITWEKRLYHNYQCAARPRPGQCCAALRCGHVGWAGWQARPGPAHHGPAHHSPPRPTTAQPSPAHHGPALQPSPAALQPGPLGATTARWPSSRQWAASWVRRRAGPGRAARRAADGPAQERRPERRMPPCGTVRRPRRRRLR